MQLRYGNFLHGIASTHEHLTFPGCIMSWAVRQPHALPASPL
jgi:hypothetical protein